MSMRQHTGHTENAEDISFRDLYPKPNKQETPPKAEDGKLSMSHYVIVALIGFMLVFSRDLVTMWRYQSHVPVVVTVTIPVLPSEELVGGTAQSAVMQPDYSVTSRRIIPAAELVQMFTSQEVEQEDQSPVGRPSVMTYRCSGELKFVRADGGFAKC